MSRPSIEHFHPYEIPGKSWGTELVVAHTPLYTGKVMHMRAGASGPLQYHEQKDETFYLFSGTAQVTTIDPASGALISEVMEAGQSCHIPPGAVHQVAAMTDCVMFEASNPIFNDRVPYVP